ncbi:hypothetical protein BHM03_00002763 [Ensete ventricosum]|nr:hypothetical protein BHM03_00002763 [Ensete ventricosum]
MVPQWRVFRVCTLNLASDKSLGYQHMATVYYRGKILSASTKESHGGDLIIQRYDQSDWRVGLLQCLYSLKGAPQVREQDQVVERGEEATKSLEELSYPKAKRRLEKRWTRRSAIVPQRQIYQLGGTSVDSSIPCSHGGRALVIKGAKEVEKTDANSKY